MTPPTQFCFAAANPVRERERLDTGAGICPRIAIIYEAIERVDTEEHRRSVEGWHVGHTSFVVNDFERPTTMTLLILSSSSATRKRSDA